MLYIINGKYYMLRNREYVSVDVKLSDNAIDIKPNRDSVIEPTNEIKVKSVSIDDVIKKLKKEEFQKEVPESKKKYNM